MNLFSKTRNMPTPEPKYKIGDTVWMLNDSRFEPKIDEKIITGVIQIFDNKNNGQFKYCIQRRMDIDAYGWLPESALFSSKEALKESL